MGSFLAAIGGAGNAAGQYGQQVRNIEANKDLENLRIWEGARNHLADMISERAKELQGQRFSDLSTLHSKILTAKPGDDLSKIIGDIQSNVTVHPSSMQALQGAGLIEGPPPTPVPGSAAGTVPGKAVPPSTPQRQPSPFEGFISQAGVSSAPPAAWPADNPIAGPQGPIQVPGQRAGGTASSPLMLPDLQAQPPAPVAQSQPTARFDAMQYFPLSENDKLTDYQYRQGAIEGHIAPATINAYSDLQKRRAEFADGIAKVEATYQQNLAHAAQIMTPEQLAKLALEQKTEFAQTGQIKPLPVLKPGEEQRSVTGDLIARSETPRLENMNEGGSLISIAPPSLPSSSGQTASLQAIPATPATQTIASIPPRLTPDETLMISAARRVAQDNGIPFDPALNPRNPLAQIPINLQAKVAAIHAESKMDPELRQARLDATNSMMHTRELLNQMRQIQMDNASHARGDRSYIASDHELSTLAKPVADLVARMGRLQDTIAQGNMQADALIAPELLSVMAGGSGSGLRMNEAEIDRMVGGRTKWESLKAAAQQWALDPSKARSITPEQQKQIADLAKTVADKLNSKMAVINDAYSTLLSSEDPAEHRKAVMGARKKLVDVDAPMEPIAGSKTYTQADINAAVKDNPGTTADQIDKAFKAKGYVKK